MSECGVGMGLGTMTAGMGGVEEIFEKYARPGRGWG